MRPVKEIIAEKKELVSMLMIMNDVVMYQNPNQKYLDDYVALQNKKNDVVLELEKFYDEMSIDGVGNLKYLEVEFQKQDALMDLDEEGEIILRTVKTGITPFDEVLFKGGIPFSTYMAIIAESNSGKSDVFYMMMASFVRQGHQVHFCSYEIGASSINRTLSHHHKNKLRGLLSDKDNYEKLSVDYANRELKDLVLLIREGNTMGCKIFMLDSLTKIKINGVYGTADKNVLETVSETLLELAHTLDLLIIVTGQKSKGDITNNNYMPYGSIQVQHHLDVSLYIDLPEDREDTKRFFWLEKNREDKKVGVTTDYNKETHELFEINAIEKKKGNDTMEFVEHTGNELPWTL